VHSTTATATTATRGELDAIVTVAMCGFRADDMVRALRTNGQWKGPIYVITDTPPEKDPKDYTVLNVKGHHPKFVSQGEFDEYVKGIHTFKSEIYSKWHKTQIFHLIPQQHNVHTALFIDADMLAQLPLSQHWLSDLRPFIQNANCHLTLYPERWYTHLPIIGKNDIALSGLYNSGMMILKRKESALVLKHWGNLLVHPPWVGRDQGKLTQAVDHTQTQLCFLPNHFRHVQNEADLIDRVWFGLFGKGTFLHISSAKKTRSKYMHWNDQLLQSCDYSGLEFQ